MNVRERKETEVSCKGSTQEFSNHIWNWTLEKVKKSEQINRVGKA